MGVSYMIHHIHTTKNGSIELDLIRLNLITQQVRAEGARKFFDSSYKFEGPQSKGEGPQSKGGGPKV